MNMQGNDPVACRLPASRELASQYLLLYELSLPFGLDLNNQIDVSKSATRMTVTAKTLSTREVLELNARAEVWLDGRSTGTAPRHQTALSPEAGTGEAHRLTVRPMAGPA